LKEKNMRKNKIAWSVVAAIAAGLAVYVISKRRAASREQDIPVPGDRHLTNVFSKAKNYGGGEFVL
jgi:hypothetical protein